MKKLNLHICLNAILILFSSSSIAQIIITSDNMPSQGDTIRVSTSAYLETQIADPAMTGYDYLWDYSQLYPTAQSVLSFINPLQTNFFYYLTFGPTVANLAVPIEGLDFVDLQVTDAFEFYKNNTSDYVRAGFAATIMGIPLPLKYDVPERIYKFPLSINSTPDSSISTFEIQYPPVAYFYQYKKRVNTVDGSGTLVTPYGSFSTLRVKSVIYERDSLYLDSLQTGIPIIRNITEYRWLSPDFPVPLLTITQEGLSYSVQYIDSVRNIIPLVVNLGSDLTTCIGDSVTLTAQVEGGNPPYSYMWSNQSTTQSITVAPDVSTIYTVLVCDNSGICVSASQEVNVIAVEPIELGNDTILCAEHNLNFLINNGYDLITWYVNNVEEGTGISFSIDSAGIGLNTAIVKVIYQNSGCTLSDELTVTFEICGGFPEYESAYMSISPNPATESIAVQTSWNLIKPVVSINSMKGPQVLMNDVNINGSRLTLDTSNLAPGLYFITVRDANKVTTGKFIKSSSVR